MWAKTQVAGGYDTHDARSVAILAFRRVTSHLRHKVAFVLQVTRAEETVRVGRRELCC